MTSTSLPAERTAPATAEELYLDLMKNCLTRIVFGEHLQPLDFPIGSVRRALYGPLRRALAKRKLEVVKAWKLQPEMRAEGHDWPRDAETMIGLKRLDNLQACVTDVIRAGTPGDLIE